MDTESQVAQEDSPADSAGVPPDPRRVLAEARRYGCCKGRRVFLELCHGGVQVYLFTAFFWSFLVNFTTPPDAYPAPPVAVELLPLALAAWVVRMAVVTLFDRVDLEAWKLALWQS